MPCSSSWDGCRRPYGRNAIPKPKTQKLVCSHCGKPPNHEGAVPYHTLCSCGEGWFVPVVEDETQHGPSCIRRMYEDAGLGHLLSDQDRARDGGLRSGVAEREMP